VMSARVSADELAQARAYIAELEAHAGDTEDGER
jgi:hypothetical protein